MKSLHAASALVEIGAGLALLGLPSLTVELLAGVPLEGPAALTIACLGGAGLLSLGVACWLARGDSESPAGKGLISAMLLYNVAAVAVLAYAGLVLKLNGIALWPGVGLHVVMTVWCAAFLRRESRKVTSTQFEH